MIFSLVTGLLLIFKFSGGFLSGLIKEDRDSQRSVNSLILLDPGLVLLLVASVKLDFRDVLGPKTKSLGRDPDSSLLCFLSGFPYFRSKVDHLSLSTEALLSVFRNTFSDIWATLVSISFMVSAKLSEPRDDRRE